MKRKASKKLPAKKQRKAAKKSPSVMVLVGTRKGAFLYSSDASRRTWKADGPHFLGQVVHHLVQDPRDGRTLLMACKAGHLGPTVFRSTDLGKKWTEAARPPAFPKAADGKGESVEHVFWLTPGHASQPGVWYAGTAPHALFRSEDGGATWDGVKGFNEHPMRGKWRGDSAQGPPDSPNTHSILVDPRDANHLYMGFSVGGFFESTDGGRDWKPLNRGIAADFLPDKNAEFGHDPHCVRIHPAMPDRLYQQNHCGLYRLDRPSDRWERIGDNMPKPIGDIGFPIVLHPRDPDTFWTFPMDGTTVWPRVSVGGKPAAYMSSNGGKTFRRLDKGLPRDQAWFTVKRQAFASDMSDPLGLYFGTTSGEVWMSRNEGAQWSQMAAHLPHIYSVETGVRS